MGDQRIAPTAVGVRENFSSIREFGGYAISVETAISGEIFGDFIGMAKIALKEEHKDVAAVLASAALEDTLKRFARLKGLDVEGKVLQDVVNRLKAKGLVSGARKSLLDSMVK